MLTIERYILKGYIGPFLFSTSVLTFVFVMDFILRYIDPFLKRGVQFQVVLQAFILSLGHMFALIIPMAVLPATLMAFGNLASENEITAMKASGISLYRMIFPPIVVGAILSVGMVFYNNHLLPESNHRLRNLLIDIYKKKPSVRIKENTFIDAFKGYTIYVRHRNNKTGEIRDIQIFKNLGKGSLPTTILAERGKLKYLEKEHILRFELENGEIHEMPEGDDPSTYRKTYFKNYIMNIEDIDRTLKRTERTYRGDREMSAKQMNDKIDEIREDLEMLKIKMVHVANKRIGEVFKLLDREARERSIRDLQSKGPAEEGTKPRPLIRLKETTRKSKIPSRGQKELITYRALESQREIKDSYLKQINRYRVEIHKKFSIPFACIIFVLIGSPIAVRTGRSGINTAIGLSILFFLVYYVCLIGGEKLADRRIISPVVSMWGANIFFGIAGLYLLRTAAMEQSLIRWRSFNPLNIFRRVND